ncbi:hypothetical protein AMTR_s00019p00244600 [Amborella trichopoda]|uniref:Uncharacterized protein n=1 Tax=Amborella trichopoda TaxID=13333 RepID=W1PBV5_AMBTC|nr:hypothetical protein AMTR_s00019p00244600 [Amborella trichopoda]
MVVSTQPLSTFSQSLISPFVASKLSLQHSSTKTLAPVSTPVTTSSFMESRLLKSIESSWIESELDKLLADLSRRSSLFFKIASKLKALASKFEGERFARLLAKVAETA